MQKLEFNASAFNMQEAQNKLDIDLTTLSINECLFFINECEFDVIANKELNLFKVIDKQGIALGDIEEETFKSLNDVIERFHDSYLIDYGFVCSGY